MTTAASDPQIVPRPPASLPELRAADQGVADALESVLSDNTRRVYDAQWRIFTELVRRGGPLRSAGRAPHRGPLPGRPRQLRRQHRHLRLATSAIAKAHEWAKLESPAGTRACAPP